LPKPLPGTSLQDLKVQRLVTFYHRSLEALSSATCLSLD